MLPEIPEEQIRAVLDETACEILAEGEVIVPPVDALRLAGRLGLVLARDGAATTRARFVRLGGAAAGQGTILLADDPRPERRQWAVAHEIGESRAYRVFDALGSNPAEAPVSAREGIANRLASCLLLPREWFWRQATAVRWDLHDLKAIFSTASHELIARRMLDMPPAIIVTVTDQGRPTWRLSNRSVRPPRMTPPETAAWRTAHKTGRAVQCDAGELPEGVADVRAWPIHEPDWRREIVRTELSEW